MERRNNVKALTALTVGVCFALQACHENDSLEVSTDRSSVEVVNLDESFGADESANTGNEGGSCSINIPPPSLAIDFGSFSQELATGDRLRIPVGVSRRVGGQFGLRLDIRSVGESRRTVEKVIDVVADKELVEFYVPVSDLGLSSKEASVSSKIGITVQASFIDGRVEELAEIPIYFHASVGGFLFYSEDVRATQYADGALTLDERERREQALNEANEDVSAHAFASASATRMSVDPGYVPESEGEM